MLDTGSLSTLPEVRCLSEADWRRRLAREKTAELLCTLGG